MALPTRFSRARIRSLAVEILVLLGFTLATVVMTSPLLSHARTHTVDIGVDDTLLYTRYARCFRDWLLGREPGYLSFDMYFPSLLSGATNDPGLGVAVQVLPLSIFFRDYLFTVNLVSLASFVLCGHATYLLVREISQSRGAGIVAGCAFAFCFYRIRQLDHPNVLQMQWLPYALYFMHRLAHAPNRRNAIAFAVALFVALTASFNLALYAFPLFPIFGAWLVLTTTKRRARLFGWLLAACAVTSVPLYFAYRPFFILRDAGAPVREAWEIKQFSSPLESFRAMPADIFPGVHAVNAPPESVMFLGWSVLVLASVGAFGLLPELRRPLIRERLSWMLLPFGVGRAAFLMSALVLICFFAIFAPEARRVLDAGVAGLLVLGLFGRRASSRTNETSPAPLYLALALFYAAGCFGLEVMNKGVDLGPGIWPMVQRIPGLEQIRTPSRFFVVTSLFAAVCAGLGAKAIAFAFPGRWMRALVFAGLSLTVLHELKAAPIPLRAMPTEDKAPPIYRALAAAPKPGAVVELPLEWSQRERQPVYYANIFRRPTVNGMSSWSLSYFDLLYGGFWEEPTKSGDASRGLDTLRATQIAGLRYVVIHNAWGVTPHFRELFGTGITSLGGKQIGTYGDDELWELPDPPPSRAARFGDLDLDFESIAWRERDSREMRVLIDFVNKTGDALYDGQKIKHFSLSVTSAGDTIGKGNGYLFPLLLTPHGDFEAGFRITFVSRKAPDWATVTANDDDGQVWGKTTMRMPDR